MSNLRYLSSPSMCWKRSWVYRNDKSNSYGQTPVCCWVIGYYLCVEFEWIHCHEAIALIEIKKNLLSYFIAQSIILAQLSVLKYLLCSEINSTVCYTTRPRNIFRYFAFQWMGPLSLLLYSHRLKLHAISLEEMQCPITGNESCGVQYWLLVFNILRQIWMHSTSTSFQRK